MTSLASLLHYGTIMFSTVASALGVSIGQGATAQAAFIAIDRQPGIQADITRTTLLALALLETGAILGLLISFFLLYSAPPLLPAAVGEIGIALSMGIPAFVIGWASAKPTSEAIGAIARQPFMARQLTNYLLLVLSLLQTPLIFGFIIALMINFQLGSIVTISQGLALVGSGIAAGIGCIGPILGGCNFTSVSCKSAGLNRAAYPKIFTFTFISQAIIETPIIFASIVALLLIRKALLPLQHPLLGIAYMVFGTTIGVGTFGAGISSGQTAAATVKQITSNPAIYTSLSRASMMAQGLIDTSAVYAFIIALWLIITPLV